MAALYAPILDHMKLDVTIVATSAMRAEPLAAQYAMRTYTKGLNQALEELPLPTAAIVALPVDRLAMAAEALAAAGVPKVLVEKPGCLTAKDLAPVVTTAAGSGSYVAIAYNRRFFASVIEARRRIRAAGQVLSFNFEFCEDATRIAALSTPDHIKENWVLANSSHVIDLAFHLCGRPESWAYETTGSLPWHSRGADFRGTGETDSGARFSYFADWRGPGRWGLEIILPDERLILRPMEKLAIMARGSFEALPVEIDDTLDRQFKPGLYEQVSAFLNQEPGINLLTAAQQLDMINNIHSRIARY
jgi:predicted dehydrogenase